MEARGNAGDGWHPNGVPLDVIAQRVQYIRERQWTRPFTFVPRFSIDMTPGVPQVFEQRGVPCCRLSGTDDEICAALHQYAQVGAEYVVLFFPMDDLSTTLEQIGRFIRDIAPEFTGRA